MIKIYAGNLSTLQQDIFALLELEEMAGVWSEMNRFYKIMKVVHVWHGKFSIPVAEGAHIYETDFNTHCFGPDQFRAAQDHLAKIIRKKANGYVGLANNLYGEANHILLMDQNYERK